MHTEMTGKHKHSNSMLSELSGSPAAE